MSEEKSVEEKYPPCLDLECRNLLDDIGLNTETPVTVFFRGKKVYAADRGHPFAEDPLLLELGNHKTPYDHLEISASPILYMASGKDDVIIVLGPYAIHPVVAGLLHDYASQNGFRVPAGFLIRVLSIIGSLEIMELCWKIVFGEYRNYAFLGEEYRGLFVNIKNPSSEKLKALMPEKSPRPKNPDAVVKELTEKIRRGEPEGLSDFYSYFREEDVSGRRAADAYRQQEYTCVAAITLMCQAAIEGGVLPSRAYRIADSMMMELSQCRKSYEMENVFLKAAQAFVERTAEIREHRVGSGYVESAKEFMEENLQTPISMDDIAAHVSLSRSQLMRLFRKQENCTVMEYLTRKRIEGARELLRTTDYTSAEIAGYFCFASPSHFSSVFRKVTGMTPSMYRGSAPAVEDN